MPLGVPGMLIVVDVAQGSQLEAITRQANAGDPRTHTIRPARVLLYRLVGLAMAALLWTQLVQITCEIPRLGLAMLDWTTRKLSSDLVHARPNRKVHLTRCQMFSMYPG